MENNTQQNQEQEKKSKTILGRLTKASRVGGKILSGIKTGIRISLTALTLGTAGYVYRQFHKSPEEIHEETQVKMEESKKAVEEAIQKDFGTNDVAKAVGKVGGKIAETGASHGGALRKWIAEKLQKQ